MVPRYGRGVLGGIADYVQPMEPGKSTRRNAVCATGRRAGSKRGTATGLSPGSKTWSCARVAQMNLPVVDLFEHRQWRRRSRCPHRQLRHRPPRRRAPDRPGAGALRLLRAARHLLLRGTVAVFCRVLEPRRVRRERLRQPSPVGNAVHFQHGRLRIALRRDRRPLGRLAAQARRPDGLQRSPRPTGPDGLRRQEYRRARGAGRDRRRQRRADLRTMPPAALQCRAESARRRLPGRHLARQAARRRTAAPAPDPRRAARRRPKAVDPTWWHSATPTSPPPCTSSAGTPATESAWATSFSTCKSPAALERRFARLLGRSPKAEILRVQLDRVKQLLEMTEYPLAKIAQISGFDYVESMCTCFKRTTGQTPGQYRAEQAHH